MKIVNMFISIYELNKDGSKGKLIQEQPGNSFTEIMNFGFYGALSGGVAARKDTGGTSRNTVGALGDIAGASGADTRGLVVGTGTNAVTIADYALQTKIAHGISAGQLQYGSHTFIAPVTTGSNNDWYASRSFTNGSGGSITVNEIGIYYYASYYFLLERTKLASGYACADLAGFVLQYRFRVTV